MDLNAFARAYPRSSAPGGVSTSSLILLCILLSSFVCHCCFHSVGSPTISLFITSYVIVASLYRAITTPTDPNRHSDCSGGDSSARLIALIRHRHHVVHLPLFLILSPPLPFTASFVFVPAEPYFPFTPYYGSQHPRLRHVRCRPRHQGPRQHGIQPVFHRNDPSVLLFSHQESQERHCSWFLLLFLVGLVVLCVHCLINPAPGLVFNRRIGFIKWCSRLYRNRESFLSGRPLDWSEQVVVITGGSSALSLSMTLGHDEPLLFYRCIRSRGAAGQHACCTQRYSCRPRH
jgi:hypothetical protein